MKKLAIKAAKEAGKLVMKYYNKDYYIKHKTKTDIATQADFESEKLIKKIISKKYPDHAFLGEEYGRDKESDYLWIIDPIDGTGNYAHNIPYFCISIGLEYKGSVILGVVYDPVHKDLFAAEKGKGSFLNGKRLKIDPKSELTDKNLVFGYGKKEQNIRKQMLLIAKFRGKVRTERIFGSFALDLCNIAANRIGICFQFGSNAWDIAAAKLILEEAGGIMTTFEGKKVNIHDYGYNIATNKQSHKKLLRLLK